MRAIRAALGRDGRWGFHSATRVEADHRGRRVDGRAVVDGYEASTSAPEAEEKLAGGAERADEDSVPFEQISCRKGCAPRTTSTEAGECGPAPVSGHPRTTADDPAATAQGENPEAEDAAPDRKRGRS